jgi:hypothetical protein
MKSKNGDHPLSDGERRITLGGAGDVKAMMPLPTPSPTSAARTRLRHAAITDTLGRYRSYENWANRVRGAWK